MKRYRHCLLGTALLFAGSGFRVAVGEEPAALLEKGKTKPAPTAAPKTTDKVNSKATDVEKTPETPPKRSADEEAIRLTGETYIKAFTKADAKSVAAHFTPDGEYVNERGDVVQGRKVIEQTMASLFEQNEGCQLEIAIENIRFVSPGVAIEDGITTFTTEDDDDVTILFSRYTAIHVKTEGKWLTASVREHAPKNRRQHRTQLQQMSWLRGDWVDEGDDTLVVFSCAAIDGGNFLLREFKIHVAGQAAMNGTQRIGWDPLTGKLKSWVFDSEGGYSEGFWHRDDDRWILKSFGVTADGEPASSTTIYTLLNEDLMTWQSVDHEIAGVEIPDSELVTIVRRAPLPESSDDTLTSKSN